MATRIYKLYANSAATTNAAASVIIQRRGVITSVFWSGYFDSTTDNASGTVELSFASVGQTTTNDTLGPISGVTRICNVGAAGVGMDAINACHTGIAVEANVGDRLYLNTYIANGTAVTNCYVAVMES